MTFLEHKQQTVEDCKAFVVFINDIITKVEQGDINAFHNFFIEGGTEEGDAKIQALREILILRYLVRTEKVK